MKYFIFNFFLFLYNLNFSISDFTSSSQYNNRKLNGEDNFESIRILILNDLIENTNIQSFNITRFHLVFNQSILVIKELIKVRPYNKAIKYDLKEDKEFENFIIVNDNLKNGISGYDLIIIPFLTEFDVKLKNQMSSKTILRDEDTKRTILGLIRINFKFEFGYKSSLQYLEYLFLQQIIHILGFSYESFEYFPGGKSNTYYIEYETDTKLNRTYIKTERVINFSKKYFNCSDIKGIPLENQDNIDIALWEARILLGDLMSSQLYTLDQVISEFTLSLLEDSNWYKPNYYTGGLMRFGKHKGCGFLKEDCDEKFNNEFCHYYNNDNILPTCSSGRLSRGFCKVEYKKIDIIPYRRYSQYFGGPENINYCLTSYISPENVGESYNGDVFGYYEGNCNEGAYNYGANVFSDPFNEEEKRITIFKDLGSELGKNNSFCVLSSAFSESYEYLKNNTFPICYPMSCTDTSLTIKIKDQYVVCPREGGKVEINGNFQGYIHCPDYNLICTGTALCNSMFDCIEKKSLAKESTYDYNYNIKTTQIYSEMETQEISIGFEESEVDNKCPINCNQCFEDKKCFRCRDKYNLIGNKLGEDRKKIKCQEKDVSKGFFIYDYVYYPCLSNCEKCNNDTICEKCTNDYYFIKYDRTKCQKVDDLKKYYSKDNYISLFPCNTSFDKCDECESESTCIKCITNYYFLGKTKEKCETNKDLTHYFTKDGGISYQLCTDYISHCSTCKNDSYCTKCYDGYYFIGYDRKKCQTLNNLDEYYTIDGGISYFPCDTNFPYCLKCSSQNTCTTCKDGYIFLRGEKTQCFTNEEDKTYIENGLYYPCNDSLPFCEKCRSKSECYQCLNDYYFVRNKNNILECKKIDIKKYYKLSDGSYKLCSESIGNCDECNNPDTCSKCISNYYFLENDYTKCINNLDLRQYYTEDEGISYYPCSIMNNCNYCSNKSICEQCKDNYYLLKEVKNDCVELDDIEKYYKNGTSYYPCSESITGCNKCSSSKTCYDCLDGRKIIYEEQDKCYDDNYFEDNKSFIKKNDTFYIKCSNSIPHCNICDNEITCTICENDYYFLNDDYKACISINNLKPDYEYYKEDELNYHTCSFKGVKNCKECTDKKTCTLCDDNFAFLSPDYSLCHHISEFDKGFYHDRKHIIYFPCINNCDVCSNGTECIQCSENFLLFADNTVCDICKININYVNDELSNDLIKKYINNYINENKNIYSKVEHYINEESNFTIIIFRAWYCTSSLIYDDYFEVNTEELTNQLKYNLDNSKQYVICYVNYKYKNYIEIYDVEKNEQININGNCSNCLEGYNLKITNNFTSEMNYYLSEVIQNKTIENDIDIFNKDDPIFNDICKNFTIENIDLPIQERRKIFFLGHLEKEIICNDINCEVESISMDNSTGICRCQIETNFDNLFLENQQNHNNITNEEYNNYINSQSSINSFYIFKCASEAFSPNHLKNNVNLYISCGFIAIQIILFGFYTGYHIKPKSSSKNKSSRNKNIKKDKKDKKEKNKSNPPKIQEFSISDDLEDDEEDQSNYYNRRGDLQKDNQEKDKQIFYNDIDEEDEGEDDSIKHIQDKDLDSSRERKIKNDLEKEIKKSGAKLTEETISTRIKLFKEKRIKPKIEKEIINSESSEDYKEQVNKKYKFNFQEEEEFSGDNAEADYNHFEKTNKKGRNNDNSFTEQRYSVTSKEFFSPSEINEIQNDIQKTEYVDFNQAIKKPSISYMEYYCKLIQLKQPIISLFSPIKALKIEESYIPTLVKLMRIVFIFALNFFFNILHLDQKYFVKKYEYFNKKYNLINSFLTEKITLSERFVYGLTHAVLAGFISFLICIIIQSFLNFFFFDIKKELSKISESKKNLKNKKDEKNEILQLMTNARRCYIIFFSIGFAIMIIIFYSSITFAEVYIGGVLDLIAGVFWTFIFLQIIPFIYCLAFAFCRYKGLKDNNEKLYNIGQSIFF